MEQRSRTEGWSGDDGLGKTVEGLNDARFEIAVMDPAELTEWPQFNAVIEVSGAFYRAELDWSTAYPDAT